MAARICLSNSALNIFFTSFTWKPMHGCIFVYILWISCNIYSSTYVCSFSFLLAELLVMGPLYRRDMNFMQGADTLMINEATKPSLEWELHTCCSSCTGNREIILWGMDLQNLYRSEVFIVLQTRSCHSFLKQGFQRLQGNYYSKTHLSKVHTW